MSDEGYIDVRNALLEPVDTSKDGIFVCGCADGPKDIPDSVTAGSAAAMRASVILARMVESEPSLMAGSRSPESEVSAPESR
jgi:heterodisulfide reductase subunit A-like polyferredoxin